LGRSRGGADPARTRRAQDDRVRAVAVAADHVRGAQNPVGAVPAHDDLSAMAIDATLDFREELVGGWGMAVQGRAHVLRPTSAAQVAAAMASVRRQGGTLALRGSGCSYGDAAMNSAGHVLDLGQMRRILSFDARRGVIRGEP